MPVPKRKRSRSRRDKRFANKGMKVIPVTTCANCQRALASHQACRACGFYKGAKVLSTKSDRLVKRQDLRTSKDEAKQAKVAAAEAKIEEPPSEK